MKMVIGNSLTGQPVYSNSKGFLMIGKGVYTETQRAKKKKETTNQPKSYKKENQA